MTSRQKEQNPQAMRDYRAAVEALIAACLARIRGYRIPDDAEPAGGRHD
jgi:hypothetical protein